MSTAESQTAMPPGNGEVAGDDPRGRLPLRERLNPRRIVGSAALFPLVVLFGLNAVDELDRAAFTTLAPEIKDHFGLGLTGVTTLAAVIIPVGLLLELPVAYWADRRNRTHMAGLGAGIWAVFTALTGFAGVMSSLAVMYVARGGSALGKTFNATHNSLLADYYPQESRARVFYAHRLANTVGMFVGPLAAGFLAEAFGWEVPFFVFAFPTLIFVVLALRLEEPTRGVHERIAAGADEITALTEEVPATFSETFRTLYASESARRIYFSLPFLAASGIGIGTLMSLFYEDVYDVGSRGRGLIFASVEPAQVIGLVIGAIVMQRLIVNDPGRAMRMLGYTAIGSSICLAMIALSPNIAVAIAGQLGNAVVGGMLLPGVFAVISLAVPPRMRTLGFATGSLWILLGLPVLPLVGAIGDRYGLRTGILIFIPVYMLGSFLLASAGRFINVDIERNNLSSRLQAEIRRRRMEGDPQILAVRGLDVAYEGTQVLFGVDFDVADGEIVAILGTNGAGKSTLLKTIAGLMVGKGGSIVFDGREISGADATLTARLGLTMVPGDRGIFPSLTVDEHLRMAGWMFRDDTEYLAGATEQVLEYFPVLRSRREVEGGNLSGGEQQMLSLAAAFIARPKLLMIDELSLGLAPTVVEQLLRIVPAIHANGTAIVLVEQSVSTSLRLAQRAVFMEKGEIRFTGATAELLERHDLVRSVFLHGAASGSGNGAQPAADDLQAVREIRTPEAQRLRAEELGARPVVLEVREITKRYGGLAAVDDVSFTLHEGEILGLIGPNGAGKTTILDLVSGFQTVDAGRVLLDGHDVTELPAHARAKRGLGRSFQSAILWPSLTVREAIAMGCEPDIEVRAALPAFLRLPVVGDSEAAVDARVDDLVEMLGLGDYQEKFVGELSTGTRRVVDVAVQLASKPFVLMLDEPSSGIAQRETDALGPLLRAVQAELDCSLLVIEHDMTLLTGLADRLVALDAGSVVTIGTPHDVLEHAEVVESYLGRGWGEQGDPLEAGPVS